MRNASAIKAIMYENAEKLNAILFLVMDVFYDSKAACYRGSETNSIHASTTLPLAL
jgi:hypothetical protein